MGFFKKAISGAIESHSGELNAFLGAGTEYRGRLDFVGTVRIDGIFHGEIVSEGSLVLGREAVIQGQISVGNLFSNGTVVGDVDVKTKAVLQKHSTLEGSLRAPALVVEEGASLQGDVEMSRNASIELVEPGSEALDYAQEEPEVEDSTVEAE